MHKKILICAIATLLSSAAMAQNTAMDHKTSAGMEPAVMNPTATNEDRPGKPEDRMERRARRDEWREHEIEMRKERREERRENRQDRMEERRGDKEIRRDQRYRFNNDMNGERPPMPRRGMAPEDGPRPPKSEK